MSIENQIAVAKNRSKLFSSIREFFDDRDYIEVDTPSLSPDLIPEPTIENFATTFKSEFLGSKELYLIPSPEVHMKKLIADGFGSIYQFSHCFRNSEQIGRQHNIEFSMLEYYSVGMDEKDSIKLTEEMIKKTHLPSTPEHALPPFRVMSVNEAMMKYADVDLDKYQSQRKLYEKAIQLGLGESQTRETWEQTFNRIFLTFVEPNLPQDKPLVLDKYPSQIDCLATNYTDGPYKRRWEMYIGGNEVANCYDELKDSNKIGEYYRKEYAKLVCDRTEKDTVIPDIDLGFAPLFEHFPQCSGVAIGMDRLLMSQMKIDNIQGVILFPFSANIQ